MTNKDASIWVKGICLGTESFILMVILVAFSTNLPQFQEDDWVHYVLDILTTSQERI